jgi:hypothetical protein
MATRCSDPVAVLVIASGNPHKVAELGTMLAAVELEVRQQPGDLEIEETGSSYAENARLKAETWPTIPALRWTPSAEPPGCTRPGTPPPTTSASTGC